jgi:cytochrome c oxidase assembly factor CtaG
MNVMPLWSGWGRSLTVLALAFAALAAYLRAARGRTVGQTACWVAGLGVIVLALISPIQTLADGYLYSAHMVRHVLMLLVGPELLLLGLPPRPAPRDEARRGRRGPLVLYWLAAVGAMWVWHEPSLCSLAVRTPALQAAQAASLVALGTVFWWPVLGPRPEDRVHPLGGVIYLASACLGCTILGILITFAPAGAACPAYLQPADALGLLPTIRQQWGLTPAADQQLGGLIMWIPACGVYLSGILVVLARYYRAAARTAAAVSSRAMASRSAP